MVLKTSPMAHATNQTLMFSNHLFARTQRLALSLAGIELVERHRELLERRSQRLGIRDDAGLDSLLNSAEEGDSTATQKLLCLLTTKFTGFFRHARHFELAAEHARRVVQYRGAVRLWSAAAATGEEPYSLAMTLIEAFQRENPPATILATDIDAEALATASCGEYGERAVQPATNRSRRREEAETGETRRDLLSPVTGGETCGLSAARRGQFFNRAEHGRWSVRPEVRRLVEFRTVNLADVSWPVTGPFDVIFCRNVLMYFDGCHRYAVLERMASLLAPDGLLLLDPTEHLGNTAHWFTQGDNGAYSRRHEVVVPRRHRTRDLPRAMPKTEL